jgi:proline dehydrogenase
VKDSDDRWVLPGWPDVVQWCRSRNDQGIRVTIDILGESSRKEKEIQESVKDYTEMVRMIAAERLDAAVTIKVSSLGYLLDRKDCLTNVLEIGRAAKDAKVGFEIDMEGRSMVDFSLMAARSCSENGLKLTIALQAYLKRTANDLEAMIESGIRIRLVKGAYAGDISDFQEVQSRFVGLAKALSESGDEFALGTHDPQIISWAEVEMGQSKDKMEIGMLKGLSDETKLDFVRKGWRVVEYVPFGPNATAYVQRRLEYLQKLKALGRSPAP